MTSGSEALSFVDSKSRIGYLSIHLVEHSFSRDPDPDTYREMMCSERQGEETAWRNRVLPCQDQAYA